MDKKKQSLASRLGTYAVGLSVLVVAIVVVLNLAVAQLPDSVLQFDISDNRLYSLTDTSKDFLATLDKDVRLVVLADPENIDGRITRFLSNYDAESDRVSLEYIDPVLYQMCIRDRYTAQHRTKTPRRMRSSREFFFIYSFLRLSQNTRPKTRQARGITAMNSTLSMGAEAMVL